MKLLLSSCDFLNDNSRKVILDNLDKDLSYYKVLFIPNEKATYDSIYSDKYYDRLKKDGFTNRDNIYIFDEVESDKFRGLDIDIIYVGGGNTFAMLDKIRKANFCDEIINYVKNGVMYIGGSCGAHIVSKNIGHLIELDDNYVGINNYDGLGLLDGVILPHYAEDDYNPKLREEVYNRLINENKYKVYKLTNDESLIVIDGDVKIV